MFSSGNPTYAVPTLTTVKVNTSLLVDTPEGPLALGVPHAAFPLYSGGLQWIQRSAFDEWGSVPADLRGWGMDQMQLLCVSQVCCVEVKTKKGVGVERGDADADACCTFNDACACCCNTHARVLHQNHQ